MKRNGGFNLGVPNLVNMASIKKKKEKGEARFYTCGLLVRFFRMLHQPVQSWRNISNKVITVLYTISAIMVNMRSSSAGCYFQEIKSSLPNHIQTMNDAVHKKSKVDSPDVCSGGPGYICSILIS